jgi:hypothetical protein
MTPEGARSLPTTSARHGTECRHDEQVRVMADSSSDTRTWWLSAAGLVVVVLGVVRLLLDVSATELGTSVSCGNAVNWLSGSDSGPGTVVCGAPLHNASIEGVVAVAIGAALLLAWLFVTGARWPLVVLVAFVVLLACAVADQAILGCILAVALLVTFGAWRGVRRRHSVGGQPT